MATQQELLNQAVEVRDADQDGENTALRVGQLLVDIIESLSQFVMNDELSSNYPTKQEINSLIAGLAKVSQLVTLQASLQSEASTRAAADTRMSGKIAELETALGNLTENITPETLEALAEAIAFLDGIGDDATLAAQLAGINSRIGSVEDGLAGKAGVDASTGRLTYSQMPHLVLASMGSDLDGEQTILGDLLDCYVYIQSSRKIFYNKANGDQVAGVTPDKGFVYCNAITRKQYIWTGDQDKPWREIDPEPRTIVSEVSTTYRPTPPDGLNDYWYIFHDSLVTKLIHLYKIGTRIVEERLDLDSRVLYYSVSNKAWYRLDGSNLVRVNVYVKPATGIPASDLAEDVIPNVSNFATKTELRSKANDNEVVKSITVNGQTKTPDNGNVNITVSGEEAREISILFVGNSLTQDAVSYLPLVLKEIAPNLKFKFYVWYDGGYTLTQILSKWNNNTAAEIFSVCENVTSWTNSNNTQKMGAFLASGKTFDVVCLEEYFNYKRTDGYTAADKQSFNDIITYLRTNYNKPFKVVSFFHRPLCKDTNNQPDLAIADEVFGLTYDGVRWQLENTISEGVIPTGIAAYRAMYESSLTGLGQFGYMSYDGTHSQEGLPCLMQAWVCALWLLDKLSIEISINNVQTRVTSANWSSINVPGPNPSTGTCVVGTTTQDRLAMDVAIKAYKEGKMLENRFISARGIPAYKIVINGASGTKTDRTVQLSASLMPTDAAMNSITWSIVSGDATVSSDGLVTYNGTSRTASVVVRVSLAGSNIKSEVTISYSLAAVETPVFSPAAGTYAGEQSVAISCATAGATIYYTTDGSTPTSASSVYSSPITVASDTTIKAIATKNGESSNVATASYTIEIRHSVTVNVGDGTNPVSGATVKLTNNGVDRTPASAVGGSYVFNVPDGTYTLSVQKVGYDSHTEQVVVNGQDVVVVVVVQIPTEIDLFNEGLQLLPLWLYAFSSVYDKSLGTVDGHGLTDQSAGKSRFSAAALRSSVEHPCAWTNMQPSATDAQKETYTLFEIDQRYPYIKAEVTNSNYNVSIKLAAGDVTAYFNGNDVTSGANPGWANSILLKNTYTSGPVYLTVNLRKSDNGQVTVLPTLAEIGLTIKAYMEDPRSSGGGA